MAEQKLDFLTVNTLRTLAIDAVQKANSGHPGLPLGAAPMAYVLWQNHLMQAPSDPDWPDRDRFVLSPGHGSMLLYGLLHLYGHAMPMSELQRFRQWESKTPGHPEWHLTSGVESTTGPLGQGSANVVGMAIAERRLAALYNREGHTVVDHTTYGIISDGDVMEGISHEAASLAGHLKLGRLICLYDANDVCLDGPTSLTFSEDVARRYESYGWHVQTVTDGDRDLAGIDQAITRAREESERPSLIIVNTTIGFGSPNKAGTSSAHGSPLGEDEVRKTKEALGWDPDASFHVPEEVRSHARGAVERGEKARAGWVSRFQGWRTAHPDLADTWDRGSTGTLAPDWDGDMPTFEVGSSIATRAAAGKVLNAAAKRIPTLLGGDADLSVSTKTAIADGGSFSGADGNGRNIHFGVREHAMGAIANGIAYHGGLHPYTATFFCFADYMRPAMRLAALNGLPATFVFTHDSVGVGEDGPTHQPVEHMMSLRCMPNLVVIRPGDAGESEQAWRVALAHRTGPVALVLSRQGLPVLDRTVLGAAEGVAKGAYVLSEAEGGDPQAILIATGSEVPIALDAQKLLADRGHRVRVVSMPSWELFDAQPADYRDSILPPAVTARVAVEAGVSIGWERYVGAAGAVVGVDRYGASAPAEVIYEQLGLTAQNVADRTKSLLS